MLPALIREERIQTAAKGDERLLSRILAVVENSTRMYLILSAIDNTAREFRIGERNKTQRRRPFMILIMSVEMFAYTEF